jgi:hypothetical protein
MVSDDSRFKMSSKVRESDAGKYNPTSREEIVGATKRRSHATESLRKSVCIW